MSFLRYYRLWCDSPVTRPGCHIATDYARTKAEVAREAQAMGWLIYSRRHYCPHCRQFVKVNRDATPVPIGGASEPNEMRRT